MLLEYIGKLFDILINSTLNHPSKINHHSKILLKIKILSRKKLQIMKPLLPINIPPPDREKR